MANSFLLISEQDLVSKIPEFADRIIKRKIQDQIRVNADALEKHLWARLKDANTRDKLIAEFENIKLTHNIKDEDVWNPNVCEPIYTPSIHDVVIPISHLDDKRLLDRTYHITAYDKSRDTIKTYNGIITEEFSSHSFISPEFYHGLCGLIEAVKGIKMKKDFENRIAIFEGLLKRERRHNLKSIITGLLGNSIWRNGLNPQEIDLLDEIEGVSGSFRESLQLSFLSANTDKSLTPTEYSEGLEVVFIEKGFQTDPEYRVIGKGTLNKTKFRSWQIFIEGKTPKLVTFLMRLFDSKTVLELESDLRKTAKGCHKLLVSALSEKIQVLKA